MPKKKKDIGNTGYWQGQRNGYSYSWWEYKLNSLWRGNLVVFKICTTFDPAFILKYHKEIICIECLQDCFHREVGSNLNVPKGLTRAYSIVEHYTEGKNGIDLCVNILKDFKTH